MPIVLSQRIDLESDYEDVPFEVYHFPRRYRNQIRPGNRFVYYQGDRHKRANRYYFGHGVIGSVDTDAESYYARFVYARRFGKRVPIYNPNGGFYESIDFEAVRKRENPPWQSSIRPLSEAAFTAILDVADTPASPAEYRQVETEIDSLEAIERLNSAYAELVPAKRNQVVTHHLDRGSAVSRALKRILGAKCQICGWVGFEKPNGECFIEAHHLQQLAERSPSSLCSDNVILVCPNCHRELHYGSSIQVEEGGDFITITLSRTSARIPKNAIEYLRLQHARAE